MQHFKRNNRKIKAKVVRQSQQPVPTIAITTAIVPVILRAAVCTTEPAPKRHRQPRVGKLPQTHRNLTWN